MIVGQGKSQSRYDSLSDSIQILEKTISELEITVNLAAGEIPILRSDNTITPKSSPDPTNVGFLVSAMPMMMRQYAEKIQGLTSRLKDAFV
jgi:hypothetical protein